MANLLKRLAGPYFEFLVGPQGEWWERCHPKRRTMVLKDMCFRNPDAVRVSMAVFDLVGDCFAETHPRYDLCGITEYTDPTVDALIERLHTRLAALKACKWKREFDLLTTDMFTSDCNQRLARRHRHWRRLRSQSADCLDEVLKCAQ